MSDALRNTLLNRTGTLLSTPQPGLVQKSIRPNGNLDIRVGYPTWSHTVVAPDGRIIYDGGVNPSGGRTAFQTDAGVSSFPYGSPFIPPASPFK